MSSLQPWRILRLYAQQLQRTRADCPPAEAALKVSFPATCVVFTLTLHVVDLVMMLMTVVVWGRGEAGGCCCSSGDNMTQHRQVWYMVHGTVSLVQV